MADVSRAADRGQVILVSGLLLAVTMLVLVMLLNTAIYTENVATRGIDSDLGEAAAFQQTVDGEVDTILAAENEHGPVRKWDALEANVSGAVELLILQQRNASVERGHFANATINTTARGIWINESTLTNTTIDPIDHTELFNLSLEGDWGTNETRLTIDGDTFTLNQTAAGFGVFDGEGMVCDERIAGDTELDVVNESAHNATASVGCDGLWSPADAIGLDVDPGTMGTVAYVGVGESLTIDAYVDAQYYVDRVTVDLTYRSPDLEYETTRTIEGAPPR